MTAYEFKDKRCWRLWEAAAPKGDRHMAAFAWRESPGTLERAWAKACSGLDDDGKDKLIAACLKAGETQAAYRKTRLAAGERLPRPRGIAVWINAGGWAEDTEDVRGPTGEAPVSRCHHCDEPAVHTYYGTCARHTPIPEQDSWREMLVRARMRELEAWREQEQKPDETAQQFYRRVARKGWRQFMADKVSGRKDG